MTVAGDTLYAGAANTPARLAKGTARQQYRMNAGATAPEWYTAPAALCYSTGNISTTGSAVVLVTLTAELFDTDGMHSTSANTSRLTCVTPGKYQISGAVEFSSSTAGYRQAGILINSGTNIAVAIQAPVVGADTLLTLSTLYTLTTGDYIELYGFQTSTGSLNLIANGTYGLQLGAMWVGP